MFLLFSISLNLNDHLFGKEIFIRFTVRVYHDRLSVRVCASFPFGFEVAVWNSIVLSFYFEVCEYFALYTFFFSETKLH